MQITDTIADLLTRIRNASSARHDTVEIPASNMKKAIVQILADEGYIKGFTVTEDGKQGIIKVTLKYGEGKTAAINGLQRVSKPGLRIYRNADELPKVMKGARHRHRFHVQRDHDGPAGPQGKHGRRSPGVHLVKKRGCSNVANWKKTHKYSRRRHRFG
jgi:small subunit ribosomal protein S8